MSMDHVARGATGKRLVFQVAESNFEGKLNVASDDERAAFEAERSQLAQGGDVDAPEKTPTRQPRPLGDIVLVSPDGESIEQDGSLFVARQKPETGTALACGKDVDEVKPGDKIAYSRYSGGEYVVDDIKLLTISEKDIVLIL